MPSLIVPTNICRPKGNNHRLSLLRESLESIQSNSLTLQMKKLRPRSGDERASYSGLKFESRSPTPQRCVVGIRKCSKKGEMVIIQGLCGLTKQLCLGSRRGRGHQLMERSPPSSQKLSSPSLTQPHPVCHTLETLCLSKFQITTASSSPFPVFSGG